MTVDVTTDYYEIAEVHPVGHPRRFATLARADDWPQAVKLMQHYEDQSIPTIAFNVDEHFGRWDSHVLIPRAAPAPTSAPESDDFDDDIPF
ncbi:MAG: hypothetical protein OXU81_19695 [Gammaproteobacteria bacterium]|nr:hypothetical protein [Gammaproteobacteria bacterium]